MTKHYRGPWNAAAVRHRQAPRVYKSVPEVGEHLQSEDVDYRESIRDCVSCPGCGYLVCSCKRVEKSITMQTVAGPMTIICDPKARGMEFVTPQPELMFEGRALRVGDVLIGWSGCDDGDIVWTVTAVRDAEFDAVRDGGFSTTWRDRDLDIDGMFKRETRESDAGSKS